MQKRNILLNIEKIVDTLITSICVEKPCKIIAVHESSNFVDVEYYDYNEPKILYNVPVKHLQSLNNFVFLSLSEGDYGTLRFFDNSSSEYYNSLDCKSSDSRAHNVNDAFFTVGFVPSARQYNFLADDSDILIGSKSGARISIKGSDITISGGIVHLASNVYIDGKQFLDHQHSVNGSSTTGGVI